MQRSLQILLDPPPHKDMKTSQQRLTKNLNTPSFPHRLSLSLDQSPPSLLNQSHPLLLAARPPSSDRHPLPKPRHCARHGPASSCRARRRTFSSSSSHRAEQPAGSTGRTTSERERRVWRKRVRERAGRGLAPRAQFSRR